MPGARIAVESGDGRTWSKRSQTPPALTPLPSSDATGSRHCPERWVRAKPGALHPVASVAAEVTTHLRLHQIIRISAGESISLAMGEGASACYDGTEMDEWFCRRVRVISQSAGQLHIDPRHRCRSHLTAVARPDRTGGRSAASGRRSRLGDDRRRPVPAAGASRRRRSTRASSADDVETFHAHFQPMSARTSSERFGGAGGQRWSAPHVGRR